MLYGYAGTILRIRLTDGQIDKEPLSEGLTESYIGGRGFVARMLFDEIEPDIDPCGEKNIFIAATGPLTGHFLPASGKTHFGSKSPATGGYADSNMGGHFGPALKYAGYDALVLTGKAKEFSYLFIEDDIIEIRSAEKYRTRGALTTERMLRPPNARLARSRCWTHSVNDR